VGPDLAGADRFSRRSAGFAAALRHVCPERDSIRVAFHPFRVERDSIRVTLDSFLVERHTFRVKRESFLLALHSFWLERESFQLALHSFCWSASLFGWNATLFWSSPIHEK
jgi:hypothetical protein